MGRVGLKKSSAGVVEEGALTLDTAQYVAMAHHINVEAGKSARCFAACTGPEGIAPGTALDTTPPLTVYNPIVSGVVLALLRASIGYVSGTLGEGMIALAAVRNLTQAPPTGGTPLSPRCSYVGYGSGRALAFQEATVAEVPTLEKPLFSLGGTASPSYSAWAMDSVFEGTYLVAPGCSVSLCGISAAGTAPLVVLYLLWEEIQI
jgi:hypothetical protein